MLLRFSSRCCRSRLGRRLVAALVLPLHCLPLRFRQVSGSFCAVLVVFGVFLIAGGVFSGRCSALCRASLQWLGFRYARQALRSWGFQGGSLRARFGARLGSNQRYEARVGFPGLGSDGSVLCYLLGGADVLL